MIIKATSRLSEGDFIRICGMKTEQLNSFLAQVSFRNRMELRRDIQIALARYAKGKPILNVLEGEIVHLNERREVVSNAHAIQIRAVKICEFIEKNVRDAYTEKMKMLVIQRYPEFSKNPQKVKSLAKRKWQKFCAKLSY